MRCGQGTFLRTGRAVINNEDVLSNQLISLTSLVGLEFSIQPRLLALISLHWFLLGLTHLTLFCSFYMEMKFD